MAVETLTNAARRGARGRWASAAVTVVVIAAALSACGPPPEPPAQNYLSRYEAAVAADAPMAWWKLQDDDALPMLVDDAVGDHDATANEGVSRGEPGPFPGAKSYGFAGAGRLTPANPAAFNVQEFTIEMWARIDKPATASDDGATGLLRNRTYGYGLSVMDSTGVPRLYAYTGSSAVAMGTGSLIGGWRDLNTREPSQWHHIIASKGPAGMQVIVDGILVGYNPTVSRITRFGYTVGMGVDADHNSDFLNGAMSQIAFYDRQLSLEDAVRHYEAAGRSTCTPVGYAGLAQQNMPICGTQPVAGQPPLAPTVVLSDRSHVITAIGTNELVCRAWFEAPPRTEATTYGLQRLTSTGQPTGSTREQTLPPGGAQLIQYDEFDCVNWTLASQWYPYARDSQGRTTRPGGLTNWTAKMVPDPGEMPPGGVITNGSLPERALVLTGTGPGESAERCWQGAPGPATITPIDSQNSPIYAIGETMTGGGGYSLEYKQDSPKAWRIATIGMLDLLGSFSASSTDVAVFTRFREIPVCVGGYLTFTAMAYDRPGTYTVTLVTSPLGPQYTTHGAQLGLHLEPTESTSLLPRPISRFDLPYPLTEASAFPS